MTHEVVVRDEDRNWLQQLKKRVRRVYDRWLLNREYSHGNEEYPSNRDDYRPASFMGLGPAVDVIDEEEAVRIVAELPGLSPDDFKIKVAENQVFIQGEKRSSRKEKHGSCTYSECSYGSFSRVISLPHEVEKDRAEANFKNGILDLRMPKSESAKAKRIKVEVET